MNAIKCVEVSDPMNFMKPVLETWADRVALVSRSFPQSESSYYLESTLVSLLSGAAWSHGVPAITEVKIKRVSANGGDRSGRMDLLMRYGEKRIALEAKLIWDRALVPGNILSTLRTACAEVVSISGSKADVLLGGVFFVPWWNNDTQKQNLQAMVLEPFEHLQLDAKVCSYDPELEFPGAMFLARFAMPPDPRL